MRSGLVVLAALGLSAPPASAEDFPVDLVAALPPVSAQDGAAALVFVGRSGQLYRPSGPQAWRRQAAGGVSLDVQAAVRRPGRPDQVLAVGAETPPFRLEGDRWRGEPMPNRGASVMSSSGPILALAIGRTLYTWDKDGWKRRGSGPRRAGAVWAASATHILVAATDGGLSRFDGGKLVPIKTPFGAGDPVVSIVGSGPAQVFARARSGAWARVERTAARALVPGADLAGFDQHAAGLGPDGSLWLAGTLTAPDGARRALLVRADGDRLVAADPIELPAAVDDRFAVLWSGGRDLVIATRGGLVRVRASDGTWSSGRVSGELPVRTSRPASAPARAR